MARRILTGVANVDIFKGDELIATAKTLLDSSITVGVSAEDIRGGQGAQLFGKYYHSSTFDINLTDTMFKLEYIAFQTGSTISMGSEIFSDESTTLGADGLGIIQGTPIAYGSYGVIGWVTVAGQEEYQKVALTLNDDNKYTFTFPGGAAGDEVCIKYVTEDAATRVISVSSNFIPDTVHLVMTANLYDGGSGASNEGTSGTRVGYITVDVPRFQFNGSQELAMSATGVASTPIAGSALASISANCNQSGYYAEIKETIIGSKWYDNVIMLAIEDSDFTLNAPETRNLKVYAVPRNGSSFLANNANLTFTSANADTATVGANTGVVTAVAAGTTQIVVTITDKPDVEGVANVTVTANP